MAKNKSPSLIKVYEYKNCSTCKEALKFLEERDVKFEKKPIVDTPPSQAELKQMLVHLKADGKTFKNLFNTSGEQYRQLNISEKIKAGLTEIAAIDMLARNGKLIKRPFLLLTGGGTTGFNPEKWDQLLKQTKL